MLLHKSVFYYFATLVALDVPDIFVANAPVIVEVKNSDKRRTYGALYAPVLAISSIVALQVAKFYGHLAVDVKTHKCQVLQKFCHVSREGPSPHIRVAAKGTDLAIVFGLLEVVKAEGAHCGLALLAAGGVRREDVFAKTALHQIHILFR